MEPEIKSPREYRHSPLTRYTRNLLKKVNRGIDEFKLISGGDRVCVAVSGGKDSLSLLHLLLEHIRFYPAKYTVGAVHVMSDISDHAHETRAYLESVFTSLGIPYDFIEVTVTVGEDGMYKEPSCFWCAWRRRIALFKYCAEHGYNKLAFGHHADDVAETTLLNLLYHGNLQTMLPKRAFFDGAFDLIRPLFYVRERDLVRFAGLAGFSASTCTCSHADDGKRKAMKKLVRDLAKESHNLHANLWSTARIWWETFGDHPLHPNERKDSVAETEIIPGD
ncbi:tRNA 2-thiocytidine biosynthesis TtcA family protein [bacterium]|nr:tRNA 2-thiocytidine biosynthesis TtcA family protein [bacterium]